MNLGRLLFSFGGRINWAKFWLAQLIAVVFWIVVFFLAWVAASPSNHAIPAALILIASIPSLIAAIAVGIKRLHDRDKSGWWLLLFYLVPYLLLGFGRIAGPERMLGVALAVASAAISIWTIVELGCWRGTVGSNQYGPDPLEGTAAAGLPAASV